MRVNATDVEATAIEDTNSTMPLTPGDDLAELLKQE